MGGGGEGCGTEEEVKRENRRGKRKRAAGRGEKDAGGQEDWSGAREIKQLVTLRRGSSQRDLIMFSV